MDRIRDNLEGSTTSISATLIQTGKTLVASVSFLSQECSRDELVSLLSKIPSSTLTYGGPVSSTSLKLKVSGTKRKVVVEKPTAQVISSIPCSDETSQVKKKSKSTLKNDKNAQFFMECDSD
jgi:hypothetical protein